MNTKQFSKWMIRIIDMNSIKIDNDYRYILQYQDIRTKFSIFPRNDKSILITTQAYFPQ